MTTVAVDPSGHVAKDGGSVDDGVGALREGRLMGHTYGVSEVVGTSETSIDDAIKSAVARANKTVRGLNWFEVSNVRGQLEDGAVAYFQVTVKLGFRMED